MNAQHNLKDSPILNLIWLLLIVASSSIGILAGVVYELVDRIHPHLRNERDGHGAMPYGIHRLPRHIRGLHAEKRDAQGHQALTESSDSP